MIRKIKRVLITALIMIMAICAFSVSVTRVNAEEGSNKYGKVINVLYDDSRSMYWDGSKRWCAAKYALEVFGAMLGENDLMNIYMINDDKIITVQGSDPKRVETIHKMNSRYWGTYFKSLERTASAIKKVNNADERWLVVVSDGEFQDANNSQVQKCIDSCTKEGIKSVYLMIGGNPVITDDPAHYAFSRGVKDSTDDILLQVTNVANQIFEHQVLPDSRISKGDSKTSINIDIPVEEIVVFAQGEGAKIGSLEYNGKEQKPVDTHTVRHSGDVLPENPDDLDMIKVDESLYGVVARFKDPSGIFEKDTFPVGVSGASLVEYYYKPAVNVNCELYLGNQKIPPNSTGLEAGKYKVKMNFTHPVTGEVVSSPLLDVAEFSLKAVNNSDEFVIDGTSGEVDLKKGTVEIHAVAELPGNIELRSDKNYKVQQSLKVELVSDPPVYKQEELISQEPRGITVKVSDAEDGSPIPSDSVNNMQFTVFDGSADGKLTWEWIKNSDNTWTGIPRSADGTMGSLPTGKTDITITADYTGADNSGTGMLTVPVMINEYEGSPLNIHFNQTEEYDLSNYLRGEYSVIEVTYPDPVTGEEVPLSEEMWNDLSLNKAVTLENGKKPRLNLDFKKGDTPGTYLIRPKCWPLGFTSVFTTADSHTLKLSGTVQSGEFTYSGETAGTLEITPLSWGEIAVRVLILLAVTALIILYMLKPKIKTRGRKFFPVCISSEGIDGYNMSARKKIKKQFWSVVNPFGPERAIVYTGDLLFGCTVGSIKIEAVASKKSFKIINKKLPLGHMSINRTQAEDMDEIHARILTYSGFTLESLDDNGMETGVFQFYKPQ